MNIEEKKSRDNQIVRDIISHKICELYCIKPFTDNFTVGKKYKVWCQSTTVWKILGENFKIYIFHDRFNSYIELKHDMNICEYFETSLKEIRKRKLNKIKE